MIQPAHFLSILKEQGIRFFTGVPDSLMKDFLLLLENEKDHVIAANEGAAVAMAAGHFLATGIPALVYLQNSGLGNAINPLTSLVNREVYGIPMLLMIGWRGAPGKKDEPQHFRMGSITLDLLQLLGIPYHILRKDVAITGEWMTRVISESRSLNGPVALVVEEGCFDTISDAVSNTNDYPLSAEEVMEHLFTTIDASVIVVTNTGKAGRLFYEINQRHGNKITAYLMNVGAMGHASSLAFALNQFSGRKVVLLDGDGSLLMHMGSLGVIGTQKVQDLHYVLLNNGAHQSVGGQPTAGFQLNFCKIAEGCGFNHATCITTMEELRSHYLLQGEINFTEIRINQRMPENLSRPSVTFQESRDHLMRNIMHENTNPDHPPAP